MCTAVCQLAWSSIAQFVFLGCIFVITAAIIQHSLSGSSHSSSSRLGVLVEVSVQRDWGLSSPISVTDHFAFRKDFFAFDFMSNVSFFISVTFTALQWHTFDSSVMPSYLRSSDITADRAKFDNFLFLYIYLTDLQTTAPLCEVLLLLLGAFFVSMKRFQRMTHFSDVD